MLRPIHPIFQSSNRNLTNLENVCYYIPYANKSSINIPEGKIIIQQYSNFLFFLESFEFAIEKDIVIPVKILRLSLFLFFMIEGRVVFESKNGETLNDAKANQCYSAINDDGGFNARFSAGKHIFFYISLNIDWIRHEATRFPLFQNFILSHKSKTKSVSYMNKVFLNSTMKRLLKDIQQAPNINENGFEEHLTLHLKQLIKLYEDTQNYKYYLRGLTNKEKIAEIQKFLDINFCDRDIIKLSLLCDKFNITERTLRRAFGGDSMSPISYIYKLRLDYGTKLLLQTENSINEIAKMCGFNSANYFCRLFRKNFGISPGKYRSNFSQIPNSLK
ncbi:helix-turn-helix transcriptional regulator [Sphingobacterium sp. GVS05A]|uniref:helix-turn-helix transcriptional regulator n=1 Tax=Sphingobacterium TaxID=28453 RepID=UPI001CBFE566|nr:helix-turn-helix transcriptional regulator [Sphingobacterium sp. GVS05A]